MILGKYREDVFKLIVAESNSLSDVRKLLKLRCTGGGNFRTIKKYIKKYNLSTEHFYKIKKPSPVKSRRINLQDVLKNGTSYQSFLIKNLLYKEGLKKEECEICGQKNEWNGKHLIMILDHINGINNDNRLENLRTVCPNCNYQLETTKRRNKKFPLCTICQTVIPVRTSRLCSEKCRYVDAVRRHERVRNKTRPTHAELVEDLKTLNNYCAVARKHGVSDNTIRKWLKSYDKFGDNI